MTAVALRLSLQFVDTRHKPLLARHKVASWIRSVLDAPAEITVRIVGDEESRRLNRDYRGLDCATNVLTFDYQRSPLVVADLVLAAPLVEREARAQRRALTAHYAHLVLHGTLHAQGWGHRHDREAAVMQARESVAMVGLGFPDPWAG